MSQQPATYYHCKNSTKRIQAHQGGTRSGKTYSILHCLVELCWRNENAGLVISVVRRTLPALRGSSMRDFFEILEDSELYNEALHNKTERTYLLFGNLVEFLGTDEPQKVRGRKRDVLFVNEANEIKLESWRQLVLRTGWKIILDYNPSDEFHWIYDQVLTRDDCDFFQTTYKDNPYLPAAQIEEIERLKEVDENYWRVFGLGQRGQSRESVFTKWSEMEQPPEGYQLNAVGLDFGFTNNPTAAVEVWTDGNGYWLKQVLYQRGMANQEIAEALKHYNVPVIADSAEPKSIAEIHGHGVNIHASKKGRDSVAFGIAQMKSKPMHLDSNSIDLIKEFRNYKYQVDKNGRVLNETVKLFDHGIDAARYAITWKADKPNYGNYVIG